MSFEGSGSIWTTELRKAVLGADYVSVLFAEGGATIRCSKDTDLRDGFGPVTRTVEHNGFQGLIAPGYRASDAEQAPDSPGCGAYWHYTGERSYRPVNGRWGIGRVYQDTHMRSIIEKLPLGATLRFSVGLDAGSNGYCAKAGLHADVLSVSVYTRDVKTATFDLDTTIVPDGDIRFGASR